MALRGIVAAVLALALGVCLGSAVAAAGPRFSAPVVGGNDDAWNLVAADVNADGNPDW